MHLGGRSIAWLLAHSMMCCVDHYFVVFRSVHYFMFVYRSNSSQCIIIIMVVCSVLPFQRFSVWGGILLTPLFPRTPPLFPTPSSPIGNNNATSKQHIGRQTIYHSDVVHNYHRHFYLLAGRRFHSSRQEIKSSSIVTNIT